MECELYLNQKIIWQHFYSHYSWSVSGWNSHSDFSGVACMGWYLRLNPLGLDVHFELLNDGEGQPVYFLHGGSIPICILGLNPCLFLFIVLKQVPRKYIHNSERCWHLPGKSLNLFTGETSDLLITSCPGSLLNQSRAYEDGLCILACT